MLIFGTGWWISLENLTNTYHIPQNSLQTEVQYFLHWDWAASTGDEPTTSELSTILLPTELRTQIAKFMGPTWGPTGSYGPHGVPINLAIRDIKRFGGELSRDINPTTSATPAKWMIAGDTGGIAQWSRHLYTLEGTKQLDGIAWNSPRNDERTP